MYIHISKCIFNPITMFPHDHDLIQTHYILNKFWDSVNLFDTFCCCFGNLIEDKNKKEDYQINNLKYYQNP